MTLGEKIKELRTAAGLTQSELAAKLKTTKQTIGKYETGIVTNLPLKRIEELAKALNSTPEFLMGWSDGRDDEDTKKEVAALSDDDLDAEILTLLNRFFPGREDYALSMLQILADIPAEKQDLALGMLQVLKDHEA